MATSAANYWHPIARADDVTDQPKRFTMLSDDPVALRAHDLRELHLKVPDASGIACAKLLGNIEGVGAFMP